MVIRSVQANDFGDYICEGANQHGAGTATINLFGKAMISTMIQNAVIL